MQSGKSKTESIQAPEPGLSAANGPSPLPVPGTANLALCNFTGQPVKFVVSGIQGQEAVTKEVLVPAFTYIWSTGWAAGNDKVLTATTPYNKKVFAPFVTSDLIAVFQA